MPATKTLRRLFSSIAALLAGLAPLTSYAGELTGFSWYSGIASVAATTINLPTAPNNDNVPGVSPNDVFVTQKNYVGIGPVDLMFTVSDTGGVTEYQFREGVANSTGLDWNAYHIELGFGYGTGFVKSTPGDGLDFDAPDFDSVFNFNPSPGIFPTVSVTEDDVYASGGLMPSPGFAGYFRFAVDVPDGITSFTIRQSPVPVPEPSAVVLASLGILVLIGCYRRKRNLVG
jgi:hypothetical protein